MAAHMIEIDEEVYEYIKSKAEPFTDTPNSVLRRELLRRPVPSRPGRIPAEVDTVRRATMAATLAPLVSLVPGAPAGLAQVLEVVRGVRAGGKDRNQATVDLANRLHIARETVADKYGRQLGLTASGFDMLVAEPSLSGLERKLVSKFPDQAAQIRDVLKKLRD